MKLYSVTITGVSDDTDIGEILDLSVKYPFVEWGVLLSEKSSGTEPRYPSAEWVRDLSVALHADRFDSEHPRFAAHLCGATMRKFMTGITMDHYSTEWLDPFGITDDEFNQLFDRTQVNFNARREKFTPEHMNAMMEGWYENMDGNIITQINHNNAWVTDVIQSRETSMNALRAHMVLHDASGGRGTQMDALNKPIAGVLNGYAGGINPSNVISTLESLDTHIGQGYIWIDMESGVRDQNDAIDMAAVTSVLDQVSTMDFEKEWLMAVDKG
jgi:hypothetical protein